MLTLSQRYTLFISATISLMPGCSAVDPRGVSGVVPSMATDYRDPEVVTWEEIQRLRSAFTALDVVRRLRPELLTPRATMRADASLESLPVVYVDRVLVGGVENLQVIPSTVIKEIRYVRATAAAERTGVFHPGGIIAVSTRR